LYQGESDVDFVSLDGSKKFEHKAVIENEYKSYPDSAKDIIKNIQDKAKKLQVGESLPDYFIDLGDVRDSLKRNITQNIHDQLHPIKNLNKLNFIY